MSNISMKSQFRQAAKAVCQPKVEYQKEYQQTEVGNTKSYTQVENLVLPPNSGALKRDGIPSGVTRSRPSPLTIRLSEEHKNIIRGKAQAAGITANEFARAVSLWLTSQSCSAGLPIMRPD